MMLNATACWIYVPWTDWSRPITFTGRPTSTRSRPSMPCYACLLLEGLALNYCRLPLLPKATDTSFYGTARKELAVIIRMLLGGTRRFQYCRSTGATQRFLAFSFGHPRPYVLQNNNAIARSRDCTAIVSKT